MSIFIILSLILLQDAYAQNIYECSKSNPEDVCILRNVQVLSLADISSIELPAGQSTVQFLDGNIPDFGESIYEQLETTTNLTITRSGVGKLFVAPLLTYLNASWNKLTRLERAPQGDYGGLRVLVLAHNQFDRIPNIKDFTAVEQLDLSYNAINFVNLNLFGRLQKLRTLDLSHNKIRSFDVEKGFRLAHLAELRLVDNQLQELDFTDWKLSQLATLDISSNLLLYLNGEDLHAAFPMLKTLGLQENQWNCRGLSKLIEFAQNKSITLSTSSPRQCTANRTSLQGICCLESYVNYVTLHSQWEIRKLQREMQTMNETLVQKLAVVREQQGAQITILEQKLSLQEKQIGHMKQHLLAMAGMIEDLIEELYLREMDEERERHQASSRQQQPAVKIVF